MRTHRYFFWLSLAALAVGGCYPQTHSQDADLRPINRPVNVIELHDQPISETFTLIGSIEAWQEAVLYFEVAGVVAEVFVQEGDLVEPGDSIARLVLNDYDLALSRSNAEADSAKAALDLLLAGTREEDLEAARAGFARAESRAVYWTAELNRNRRLLDKNTISSSQFEQVQREYDSSVQEELVSKAQLARAVAGPRKEEIDAALATAKARSLAAAQARRQLEKATLKAPFRGRVEKRFLDVGAYVNVFPSGGVPVVHLVDLGHVDAVIAVPETHLSRLTNARSVKITSAVDPRIEAEGKIIALGRLADRASGTYELRARIPNPGGRFTGGMVVSATITSPASRQAIRIPLAAVCRAYGQPPYVLLVKPDSSRVVARNVELGPISHEQIEISRVLGDGELLGELLIVRGQDSVIVGDTVKYQRATGVSVARMNEPPP